MPRSSWVSLRLPISMVSKKGTAIATAMAMAKLIQYSGLMDRMPGQASNPDGEGFYSGTNRNNGRAGRPDHAAYQREAVFHIDAEQSGSVTPR